MTWNQTRLADAIKVQYPIFQAPMAGVTTPDLVAAVSNAGGLGNIGAGYLSAEQTKTFIREVKKKTKKPFGINLFVPEKNTVSQGELEKSAELLHFCMDDLSLDEIAIPPISSITEFDHQIEVVLEEKLPVCSFTFGIPSAEVIRALKRKNIVVIGTATTVKEAQLIEEKGMDAVVVQGSEAGGHRGSFLEPARYIGLFSLLPQVVDAVSIPVIGAGGIMDGRGVIASRCLGAEAAQMGTAFLTTTESGANPQHKEAILQATEEELDITRSFSGKPARGIQNDFINKMKNYEGDVAPYPYQHKLTKKIRSEAAKRKDTRYMSLWSGQSPRLSKQLSVDQLMGYIIEECEKTTRRSK